MKKLLGLVLLVIMFVSGCGTPKGSATTIDFSNLTPSQVVETYYKSIASSDYSTAKACLADDISQQYISAPDSYFKNIKQLTDLKVSTPAPIKLYGKNFDEVQVTADFVAEYKKVITSNSGKQTRFIYVGKKEKDSPWKIISIGTGP